ncbi:XAP5-domain-containing protein [Durotheca rogersii]|uniref:XAP5-domain-containing protein n=1 Tax=Durotheca rogersii TaxID=419775 RepID=UPI00221E5642|nr:XAP5-domain-containing protein [Durotheca rogersii]KAI5861545.1 XAP5-domain-containing protein [Durotheca rogersii]
MASSDPRFTPQNTTTQQRLSSNTVGLVALSDFRKRRAEVLEQQEREAREAREAVARGTPLGAAAADTPSSSERERTATPDVPSDASGPRKKPKQQKKGDAPKGKKAKKRGAAKLSFGVDEDEDGDEDGGDGDSGEGVKKSAKDDNNDQDNNDDDDEGGNGGNGNTRKDRDNKKSKFQANASVSIVPRVVTKAALRREAAEREALRREFLARQEATKAAEIAVPFVFYDGTDIPGGVVRVRKGDFIWVFLDKSRKVGADLGVGEKPNSRREWARVGVDDLMIVRGNIIIPHHYDFMFFIMNKTIGPTGKLLFDYSTEDHTKAAESRSDAAKPAKKPLAVSDLEGASDDPAFTKVVDRRWYERNKHIYPASVWQQFDPEKDYQNEVRRDTGGNAFFYS